VPRAGERDWISKMHPVPWLEQDGAEEKYSNWTVWRCGRCKRVDRTAEVMWKFGKMMVSSEERRAVSVFAISRVGMFIRRSSSVRRGMRVTTSIK
jgi:hypothetical protein